MLLYSTVLETRDIAEDDFIRLVIRCNQENLYPENVIRNLKWNGERNVRYGDDDLWLEIAELKEERIIAVRYEKKAANGAVWDTDCDGLCGKPDFGPARAQLHGGRVA